MLSGKISRVKSLKSVYIRQHVAGDGSVSSKNGEGV